MKHTNVSEKNSQNNVTSFIENTSQNHPTKPIFYSPGAVSQTTVTFGEFSTVSARIAAGFASLGINHGDRVILFVPMSVNLYLAMSSLQRIGAIPVFLDAWTRHVHMKTVIEQVSPKAIISVAKAYALLNDMLSNIPLHIVMGPGADSS